MSSITPNKNFYQELNLTVDDVHAGYLGKFGNHKVYKWIKLADTGYATTERRCESDGSSNKQKHAVYLNILGVDRLQEFAAIRLLSEEEHSDSEACHVFSNNVIFDKVVMGELQIIFSISTRYEDNSGKSTMSELTYDCKGRKFVNLLIKKS